MELNSATFEQFRELGLSINQTERLISQRDGRGGFNSTSELDEVWGLPTEVRAGLKRRAYVASQADQ